MNLYDCGIIHQLQHHRMQHWHLSYSIDAETLYSRTSSYLNCISLSRLYIFHMRFCKPSFPIFQVLATKLTNGRHLSFSGSRQLCSIYLLLLSFVLLQQNVHGFQFKFRIITTTQESPNRYDVLQSDYLRSTNRNINIRTTRFAMPTPSPQISQPDKKLLDERTTDVKKSSIGSSVSNRRHVIETMVRMSTIASVASVMTVSGITPSSKAGATSVGNQMEYSMTTDSFTDSQKLQSSLLPQQQSSSSTISTPSFGQWNQYDKSASLVISDNTIPPEFSTYLTKFLIRYDTSTDGYNSYWKEKERMYRLLPHNEQLVQLSKTFSKMSKSTENAIVRTCFRSGSDFPITLSRQQYDKLWGILYRTYSNEPDAKRHIAILFTLLPPELQPIDCLQRYYNKETRQQSTTITTKFISNHDSATVFDESLIELLPANYHVALAKVESDTSLPSSFYFVTNPPPFASTITTTNNEMASSLAFGLVGDMPMIRDTPRYGPRTYSLLALAGASSCALTHTIVIPLDVVKTRAQTDPKRAPSINNNNQQQEKEQSGSSSPENDNYHHEESVIPSSPPLSIALLVNTTSLTTVETTEQSKTILSSAMRIVENEGIGGLLLGAEATIVGYFWYGLSVYPSYTFFKRYITNTVLPIDYATIHGNEIAIIAGAMAAVIASFGITPIEAARIRVVAEPQKYRSIGLLGTLKVIGTENPTVGWKNLYAGLPPLLTRQVLFGSIKFFAFELASDCIYSLWPTLHSATWTQLIVTLLAGGCSGVIASVISQPADSVLTYIAASHKTMTQQEQQHNNDDEMVLAVGTSTTLALPSSTMSSMNVLDGLQTMIKEDGIGSLFRGLGSRCIWAGSIIAGQFFLYDIARSFFHVTGADLSQIYELTFVD